MVSAQIRLNVERRRLIVDNLPLVRFVLGKLTTHVPAFVDRNDLLEAGIMGLIDAALKFDPTRNVRFQTYAMSRARGAILDEMRRLDWLPRSARDEVSKYRAANEKLSQQFGRPATVAEVADALDLTVEKAQRIANISQHDSCRSLEEPLGTGEEGNSIGKILPAAETRDVQPALRAEAEEEEGLVADAVDRLGDKEQQIIRLHYYDEMLLQEIAQFMGLSNSRISQVHRKALTRLRRYLRLLDPDWLEPAWSPDVG
jgi:RNA polymerase sigma factor for flagellar operon FliA